MAFENRPSATATFGPVATPVIDVPAINETVYSEGFESGLGGWNTPGGGLATSTPHSGTQYASASYSTEFGQAVIYRPGFSYISGHSYTIRAWVRVSTGGTVVVSSAAGSYLLEFAEVPANTWTLLQKTFTPDRNTDGIEFYYLSGLSDSDFLALDDVTITHYVAATYATTPDLPISDGEVALDEGTAPFGLGLVTVPLMNEDLLEQLNPNAFPPQRVTINADAGGTNSRTFNLAMMNRIVDHQNREVRIDLATDEYLLQSYADVVDVNTRANEANLRNLINDVLSRAVVYRRNLALNPFPVPGGATADYGARWGFNRTFPAVGEVRFTAAGSQDSASRGFDIRGNYDTTPLNTGDWVSIPVKKGELINLAVRVKSNKALTMKASLRLHNGSSWIEGQTEGTPVALIPNTYARVEVTYKAPADGYVVGSVRANAGVALVAGDTISAQQLIIEPGVAVAGSYFDGGSYPTTGSKYDGATNASTSRLTAYLQPGTTNADLTAQWTVTNLVPNPNVRTALGNFVSGGPGVSSIIREPGVSVSHGSVTTATKTVWTGSAGANQGGAWTQGATTTPNITATPGKLYRFSVWVYSSVAKAVALRTQVYAADGTAIRGGDVIATTNLPANTWTRVTGTYVAPENAAKFGPFIYVTSGQQWVNGEVFWTNGWMVTEGPHDIPSFDGGFSDSRYTYKFEGDANNSPSTRVPTDGVERLPELFNWKAGVTAWDFLTPLINSAKLRLFCDEQRRWYLIDPTEYNLPGRVTARTNNTTQGTDEMGGLSGQYATGVVVRYSWVDEDGNNQTKVDTAGVAGRVRLVELSTPYARPGMAQAILNKMSGQGRTQSVTVATDYSATPAMEVGISLPGTADQIGRLTRVSFVLNQGLMDLESAGLRTTPAGAIDLLNGSIDALPGTIDSLS